MNWGILDYGVGNLGSIQRAIAIAGGRARLVSDESSIRNLDVIVLPGVGAFGAAMQGLERWNATDALKERVRNGGPILGICLGMHILFEGSAESPGVSGLGVFPGVVHRLEHGSRIGWETLRRVNEQSVPEELLATVNSPSFFFCHNYFLRPSATRSAVLESGYGEPVTAMVAEGSVVGLQFHPERSQVAGMLLLKGLMRSWRRGA